ncbi:hypothetical protein SAMN05216232_0544 [Virgibacillus subterraneus]|uniref:Uncharacterized protein n=1 Tax=Virgibacillus subterraneus TaxID=621109 RepID=A0A1H8ZTH3_9BACI|nr:hypothetical protein [Virgibacillus subterraneus]SEP67567.1 hypothetical protein SAMN05216232_0544 [Virgibacillus subterraneus]
MLKIHKPQIIKTNTGVRIQTAFEDERSIDTLWYEVEEEYSEYLTDETADGFLVGLLFYALKNGYDIEVVAPVSQNLYYSLNNYLLPLLAEVYGYSNINIYCSELITEPIENKGAVGTGLSCGIDSFATIIDHLDDKCPENYKITYYTFFNVGSHGDNGGEKARKFFRERAKITSEYAREIGKEFISVDSNISEVLHMNFKQTNTLRSLSAVLILQKLFKVYYYSSSVPLKRFRLVKEDTGAFDIFNMSMLSTETIRFFSGCPFMTRIEKTELVANYKPSYRYLNVCYFNKYNCGKCPKCLKTLLILEVIGKIECYSNVFNLKAYYSSRHQYIATVLAKRKSVKSLQEVYEEMLVRDFTIPFSSKFMAFGYIIKFYFISKFMGKGTYTRLRNLWSGHFKRKVS